VAVAWQIGPLKTRFVRWCHRIPAFEPFGLRADGSCVQYGLTYGLACAGACAPLMLFAMMAPIAWLSCLCAGGVALVERVHKRPPNGVFSGILLACALIEVIWAK
jgi:predicted metal-binding membrane protein